MRILIVATNIDVPGTHGGSTHVTELVAALGAEAQTLLLARRGSSGPGVVDVGLWPRTPPFGLRHAMTTLSAASALRCVRRFAPDVIYERGSSYGTGALLGLITGAPVVCMVLDEHVSPISLARASRIIATDPGLVPSRYRPKTIQVSWGANVERFHAGVDATPVRARFGLGARPVVTYAGSFRSWHGVDVLLAAMTRMVHADVDVLLVGDGPERAALERETTGTRARVQFTGALEYEAMPAVMAASDVFVAPFVPERHPLSRRRGFVLDPLKVFEALASETPTISVRTANLEAMFRHGEHLCLTPSGDPRALAQAIDRLLDAPDLARAMARRGGAAVRQTYTWAAHADQLRGIFETLVRGARAA